MRKPKILYFDIETSLLKVWVWGTGKQYVSHKQLAKGEDMWGIICITYCWNDGKPAQSIDWGYKQQNTLRVVEKFDKIIAKADHVIGKNSDRFDVKMINACRMLSGLPGYPEWSKYTDDLEKQMRKYFRLPSQSLDYISHKLGLGGKIKMEFQDWIDIVEKNENGLKSFNKMIKYGKKDVEDTRYLFEQLSEHFEPKFNMNDFVNDGIERCRYENCGSTNLRTNGTQRYGRYRQFICVDCGRYAGRILLPRANKLR